ncbi:hypothetical protein PF005_g5788 [Phytophthora fragariae]|uniref:Uncharacterized protein n=1 Tax=Phytophthora fragariae TaxID=53985 RepID=A0A6A3STC1_9STRA|nr:hypothetical protein PF007_g8315 [Phytophthora fragariae]KAE9150505.1 hypothetical protein PF006_g5119 [Phytophthora fragariae]KAE9224734.1 hypothetical protein PF005_g5788 [Phytophthora fragariae]KAE9251859.1 hypothetical protein PF004_g2240 [Phytophthora fragariae]
MTTRQLLLALSLASNCPLRRSSVQFVVARQPLALCNAKVKVSPHKECSVHPPPAQPSKSSDPAVSLACRPLDGGTSTLPSPSCQLLTVNGPLDQLWSIVRPFRPSLRASSGAHMAALLH